MSKLIDSFPEELRKQVTTPVSSRKNRKSNKINKLDQKRQYAFPKIKKLPLETKRNVLSALNHFDNVSKVSEEDKKTAYKKIIKAAESFEICTMGFIDKYKDKYYLEHKEIKEV